ncbi:MarR family winged helix-turn-helix transcriptional regulator [Synechococcus sp. PCC 7336]|uniref:MarR family winged helix-turn-helix transcriptional regulator n=1 Tax=Synechococcus sp. PCC 7336 TaxID=195250 RepID=UPI00034C5F2D|nr:MarR family winged helix-turn-helix transcriptional regulator [Synechococcus sp. PCC 7336]
MTQTFFDTELSPLSKRVMVGLTKIATALQSQSWQDAEALGLSPTQGKILALLLDRDRLGIRLSLVAEELEITAATASDAVKALVSKGLVDKARAADDRRAIAITLTEKGRSYARQAAGWTDFLAVAVDELSEAEQEVFLAGLIKIIRKLQERGQSSVARMCVTCQHFRPNVYANSDRPHHCTFVDAPFGERHLQVDCPDHLAQT